MFITLTGFSGCNKKEEFVLWETSHWEKIKDGCVSALAIDPKDSDVIYIGIDFKEGEEPAILWKHVIQKSNDGGKHWDTLSLNAQGSIEIIGVDPNESKNIWVGIFPDEVFMSKDGGIHFEKDPEKEPEGIRSMFLETIGEEFSSTNATYVNPTNPNIILRIRQGHYFVERSEDKGMTWNNMLPLIEGGHLLVPKNPSVIYCVDAIQATNLFSFIYISYDFGKTWERSSLPPLWIISLSDVVLDLQNPNVLYAGNSSGLFKTVEGKGYYEYYPIGDSINTPYIYVDPKSSNSLYTVNYNYNSYTTFKSSDYGKTWEKIGEFYFNPLYSNVLVKLTITALTHPPFATRKLYVSLDNGKNWKLTDLDLNESNLYNISMGVKGIIYAETYKGLFKSEDKGLHWTMIADFGKVDWGVVDGSVCFNGRVLVDPNNPDIIYWTTHFAKSIDGGKRWNIMNVTTSKYVFGSAIAVDPHNSNTIYIGTVVTSPESGDMGGEPTTYVERGNLYQGMLKSTDGGKHWKKIGLTGYTISAIEVSPVTGIIYAGTYYNGLLKSKDSGKTWERITLDNDFYISVSSLAIDSKNSIVYVGVLGGGIFKIKDKN